MGTNQPGMEVTSENGELPSNCEIVDSSVLAEIHKRVSLIYLQNVDEVATTSLMRYLCALTEAEREVRALLTKDDILLICDVLMGTYLSDVAIIHALAYCIEDSIHYDGTDEKWGVDGDLLVAKMRGLSLLQRCAVLDMVERFRMLEDSESIAQFFSEEPSFQGYL